MKRFWPAVVAALSIACTVAFADTKIDTNGDAPEENVFLTQVRSHFADWDRDHDTKLSFSEIDRALADPEVKGPAAVAAATLRFNFKLHDLGLSEYADALTRVDVGKKSNGFQDSFAAFSKKLAGIDRRVFPAGLPKGAQLAQGHLGDCFLIAGVGTMAQVQPDRLKAMVEERPDGNTAVTFGNGQRVELPAPTDGEVLIGSTTRGDGVWGNVFEKAIGQRYLAHQKADKFVSPYSIIAGGGTPNVPLAMLTGHKATREGCEMFQKPGLLDEAGKQRRLEEIRNALETAFAEHRLVIGGTADIKGPEVKVKGLYYDHSYGVLGYDRRTDMVSFWNPMSNLFKPKGAPGLENGYATSYGHFECPLTDTVQWFGSFTIEQNEKLDAVAEK